MSFVFSTITRKYNYSLPNTKLFMSLVQIKDYMYMVADDNNVHIKILIQFISPRAHNVTWQNPIGWKLNLLITLSLLLIN